MADRTTLNLVRNAILELNISHGRGASLRDDQPALRVVAAKVVADRTQARVELEGDFPQAMQVQLSLAGLMLVSPQDPSCTCWVELIPTLPGERRATTEASKAVLECSRTRVVAVFVYRQPIPDTLELPEIERGESVSEDSFRRGRPDGPWSEI